MQDTITHPPIISCHLQIRVLLGLCYASYAEEVEEKGSKRALPTLESCITFPQHSSSPDPQVFYRHLHWKTEIIAAELALYSYNFGERKM